MKHLFVFLLLLGVAAGLTLQPTQAFAMPMPTTDMMMTSDVEMAATPGCAPAMSKNATPAPCKCGIAGCLAMMASDAPMMRAEMVLPITAWAGSSAVEHHFVSTVLSGRTTIPEPDPPSALI